VNGFALKRPANVTGLRVDSVREIVELLCHQEKGLCQEDGNLEVMDGL